jgi:hypothetical protein
MTKTLAYLQGASFRDEKKYFITLRLGINVIKLFSSLLTPQATNITASINNPFSGALLPTTWCNQYQV